MNAPFDECLVPEFDSIIDNDDQIVWTKNPKFIPYIFSGFGSGSYAFAFGIVWILVTLKLKHINPEGGPGWIFFWIIALVPISQGLYLFCRKLMAFPNTTYLFFQKKVMMRSGFAGRDYKAIDYDKISDIVITVNIIERIFQVGTLSFFYNNTTQTAEADTPKMYDSWNAIADPCQVLKKIKEIMVDNGKDHQYPLQYNQEKIQRSKSSTKEVHDMV